MAHGGSTAEVWVLWVDATKCCLLKRRRLSFIVSLRGVKQGVLAGNKLDLVDYDESVFSTIVEADGEFSRHLNVSSVTAIPLSAKSGDNVIRLSDKTGWYFGPTLLGFLESVEVGKPHLHHPFRFPIQWVNRPDATFRGYSGTVVAGRVERGQKLRVLPSGNTTTVKDIVVFDNSLTKAVVGQAVTLTLDNDIDISRGDVVVANDSP